MTESPQQPEAPQQPVQPPQPAVPQPAQDLTMAWLPHLLLIFTWFIGPMIVWLIKKDEDKLAAFHAKQAMFWGVAVTAACVAATILCFIPFVGCLIVPVLSLAGLANLAYVIYAIVQTAQGSAFKYYFIADKFCEAEYEAAYGPAAPVELAEQAPQEPQEPEEPENR